ncbi:hypothetical protein IV102_07690 [bacterium]|nr:hypothetical protein [bacterium]
MPDHSYKKLFFCLALICGASGLMQVLVFGKRKDLHFRHHPDTRFSTPQEKALPSGPALDGTVSAIGMDRIHMNNGAGSLATFRCDNPSQYKIGQKLRITYAQGTPPTALEIETLSN